MNHIRIMSRNEAKGYSYKKNIPESAIISIYSDGDMPCRFYNNRNIKAIKNWCFDDLDDNRGITQMQAREIAKFVIQYQDIDTLIVHCDAGISRSAGIAAAISKWYFGSDDWVFDNNMYHPNMRCYNFMLEELYFNMGGVKR